jgi:hypothetical protein
MNKAEASAKKQLRKLSNIDLLNDFDSVFESVDIPKLDYTKYMDLRKQEILRRMRRGRIRIKKEKNKCTK